MVSARPPAVGGSALHRQLAARIAQWIEHAGLATGDRLNESQLALQLQVSRTPVRAALEQLVRSRVLSSGGPRQGFRVAATGGRLTQIARSRVPSEEDALYVRIARDWVRRRIEEQFSEADIQRRYGVNRRLMLRVLHRMAREGVIVRNAGYGWRFDDLLRSEEAIEQSYRFRLIVEPAALLEPGYRIDDAWLARCRSAHESILEAAPARLSMIDFFEINAEFHERIAGGSGNAFFLQATRTQNQLRRFLSYGWSYGEARIRESCTEHLAIITALEHGRAPEAARLMRAHLVAAAATPAVDQFQRE